MAHYKVLIALLYGNHSEIYRFREVNGWIPFQITRIRPLAMKLGMHNTRLSSRLATLEKEGLLDALEWGSNRRMVTGYILSPPLPQEPLGASNDA